MYDISACLVGLEMCIRDRVRHASAVRLFFFFFKQKTAYEIMPSLVGSEMCIRDRDKTAKFGSDPAVSQERADIAAYEAAIRAAKGQK